MKKILNFFDKLEDKIRAKLSKKPILYSLIGGACIVLFWRGIWMTADMFSFMNGPVSIIISVIILLATGLFVSFFIGDVILISGLKKEKKIAEKTEGEIETEMDILKETEEEIDTEMDVLKEIKIDIKKIKKDIEEIKR
ncbi:MAG: hypothetical protein WDK96_00690 [Candidatus Paceibacterota bacterium]|jgi:hypothetical protein